MGVALTAGTNMGIRHVLPIYPFLILAAAAGAWALARRHQAWAIVVAALLVFHLASSLHTLPDYLAYSNELFGGNIPDVSIPLRFQCRLGTGDARGRAVP